MDGYKEYMAEKIYQLRIERGMSARELSLSLGYSPGYINKIENKRAFPSFSAFIYLCEYFHITPADFFSNMSLGVK